jgi:hypothetical protein
MFYLNVVLNGSLCILYKLIVYTGAGQLSQYGV